MPGESLGDRGKILWIRKAVCACPSRCFGLVANEIVDVWKDFLELSTEELRDEGSREVEDEVLRVSYA